ncbi:hypothetical protein GCM10023091_18940 [Ravibacter arvi]|uniref:Uncharacterized protein n=1 Tax=Ravibacter arvi TaxID=2051041 RepID=A0ABP8LXZ2_9BACT
MFSAFLVALTLATCFGVEQDNRTLMSADALTLAEPIGAQLQNEDEILFGSSCYVDVTETVMIRHFASRECDESDGSWTSDAPEGIHFNDHNDEQTTTPMYSWIMLTVHPTATYSMPFQEICPLHPGSNYPPPQA